MVYARGDLFGAQLADQLHHALHYGFHEPAAFLRGCLGWVA